MCVLEVAAQVPFPLVGLAAHQAHFVAHTRVGLGMLLEVRWPLGVVVAALGRADKVNVVAAINVGTRLVDLGLRQGCVSLLALHFCHQ